MSSQCPAAALEGIDVSHYAGTIDWAQVAKSGRQFAFIKASQGTYYTDGAFIANWANAKASGVFRSAYHFFDPTIDGVTQANFFLAKLGTDAGELPPMLDLECPTSKSSALSNCEFAGNSGWAPSEVVLKGALDWLSTVANAVGRRPIVYSYSTWFSNVGVTDPELASYPLFIATSASCASVPVPWTKAAFWQYKIDGTVPGISAATDLDRWLGTRAELTAFADCAEAGTCAPVGVGAGGSPGASNGAGGAGASNGASGTSGAAGGEAISGARRASESGATAGTSGADAGSAGAAAIAGMPRATGASSIDQNPSGGCDCHVARRTSGNSVLLSLAVAGIAVALRRRHS